MRIVLIVLVFALTLYALLDCARTPEESMPARMPKFLWIILIVLFPTIGPGDWLVHAAAHGYDLQGGNELPPPAARPAHGSRRRPRVPAGPGAGHPPS